ncbi:MAG: MFS transporter [Labrys sp. (in: a-proteobacteria)]
MSSRLPIMLSAGNFVVGLAAFVVIGLVSPIASAYGATVEQAGRVMTWYAMAYAVGAPFATALTGSLPRRLVLTSGLVLLGFGAVLGALAPTLLALELSRVVVAIGAGLFTPGAAAVAIATVAPERRARALSVVFAGLTLAQVFGVPLGSWAGYTFGFATTFWGIAVLSIMAAVLVFVSVPRDLAFQPASLGQLGRTIATPRLLLPVLFTTTIMAAVYVVYTFLGPLIEGRYGFGRDGVTAYLTLFGIAAVFGNFIGGFCADRFGPSRTLIGICLLQILFLPTVALAPVGPAAMGVLVTAWSLCGWSFMTPQQSRLVAIGSDRTPLMLSLNASAIYLGVAIGSAIGGMSLTAGGWTAVAVVACLVAGLALVHLIASDRLAAR